MYILIIVGDMTWIVRNLKNMEDSIFNSKPAKHLNLDDSDLDVVDNDDENGTNIEISDLKNVKLSIRKNLK